ncbi:Uncharacterized damage-inducible protein DinB (forms a four-helix bundle) [Parapedobacter composti]|uniref:Uncharacterized damage-inducible protein DinB (Forms a four-helix bundle) n=1 Tax=Parapedobacter composti TaxID=623281 RepID=A0A1I1EUV4_9SPHI|nr:DinB family protein [Parapedobacter composti]SFB90811.1 Uncharacterized damage-inducible protein DinB (forms a four-helix bundle) [Parapedobacter composti]
MMTTQQNLLKELFAYNFRCNQQLAEAFERQQPAIDPKSLSLFSHILNAHQIWNGRISRQQPNKQQVWANRPFHELAATDRLNHEQTLAVLDTHDLTANIAYTTSTGSAFSNTVGDILFHIVNHSTYHRGQIALLFRQHGLEPLVTDFIFFKR